MMNHDCLIFSSKNTTEQKEGRPDMITDTMSKVFSQNLGRGILKRAD